MAGSTPRGKSKKSTPHPEGLTGKLVFFTGLADDKTYGELDQKMALISDDQQNSNYNSMHVFGYIINEPNIKILRDIFKDAGQILHHELHTFEVMENLFGVSEGPFQVIPQISIITSRSAGDLLNKTDFDNFSVYDCETLEEAAMVAGMIVKNNIPHIATQNLLLMESDRLVELIQHGHAKVKKADPAIVFEKSALVRTARAFPGDFNLERHFSL